MTIQRDGTRYGLVVLLLFPMVVLSGCQDAPSVLGPAGIHEMAPALSIASLEEIPEAWTEIPAAELEALLALYEATDGDNWTNNEGWLDEETPPSEWHGVVVSDGRVRRLLLDEHNLSGEIPAELGSLGSLESLHLSWNNLSGAIPPELGNLESLAFFMLGNNNLSGEIPPELGNLGSLEHLSLLWNNLSGEEVVSIGV